MLFMVTNSCGF